MRGRRIGHSPLRPGCSAEERAELSAKVVGRAQRMLGSRSGYSSGLRQPQSTAECKVAMKKQRIVVVKSGADGLSGVNWKTGGLALSWADETETNKYVTKLRCGDTCCPRLRGPLTQHLTNTSPPTLRPTLLHYVTLKQQEGRELLLNDFLIVFGFSKPRSLELRYFLVEQSAERFTAAKSLYFDLVQQIKDHDQVPPKPLPVLMASRGQIYQIFWLRYGWILRAQRSNSVPTSF